MREPVRTLIHLGSGNEGQQRKAALEQIAETLTNGNVSAMIQMIADGQLEVRMSLAKRVAYRVADHQTWRYDFDNVGDYIRAQNKEGWTYDKSTSLGNWIRYENEKLSDAEIEEAIQLAEELMS